MKKILAFGVVAVLLSAVSVGCTTTSSSGEGCRLGSLWPSSRTRQESRTVYTTSVSSPAVATVSAPMVSSSCNPCDMAAPCPCEPVCNPCDMSCGSSVISGGVIPHPGG